MTKFLHLIIAIIFAPTYLFSETVIIYATQSAQYSANDCCTLNILTNQNSDSLYSQNCQDMGTYYGCGMSKHVPFWLFDLSTLDSNIDIQSIQLKGNLPTEGWSDVYLSISTTIGQISTTIASNLWNGGVWASGHGQYSSINWAMGDFSQNLPLEIISQGIISGQLNILTYTSNPWTTFSIVNSGDNAPRLVIDYENIIGQVDYETQIQTIFNNNCTSCHINGGAYYGGLDLSSYDSLMAGSNNGAVVVSGDHANSLLWQKVNSGEMPPQNNPNLTNDEISLIAQWIDEGALLITTYEGLVWCVSTTGSDSTGDGSEANPFVTIQKGIDTASDGDTVLVSAGTYIENINYNGKNIAVIGENRETTIIDGNQNYGTGLGLSVVTFENEEDSTSLLSGFTIKNGYQMDPFGGAGIRCFGLDQSAPHPSPRLENLIVTENHSMWLGGGITYFGSSPILNNLIISRNTAEASGAGIMLKTNVNTMFGNVTIVDNENINGHVGSGIFNTDTTSLSLVNCILSNNSIYQKVIIDSLLQIYSNNYVSIAYSNIRGGEDVILFPEQNGEMLPGTVNWGEGNIDANPKFCNPDSGDYTLAEDSPCIGTGENGANMGATSVGCGPYNFSPTNFSLSAPSNNAQITIDDSNMNDGFITFSWDESSDENGDSLVYLMHATSTDLEDFSLDTNVTSIKIPYMELVDEMSENNITSATIEWTVDVTDGIDTVTADNAPFTLNVNGSDALSALAEQLIPQVFALHQNYPNPFNPITTLRYDLPEDANVNITIYDLMGRSIRSLVNSRQTAGYRSIQWNATNNLGEPVSAGMYIYTIQAGEFRKTKKMVLLK